MSLWNKIIPNETLYDGDIVLKLERYSQYTENGDGKINLFNKTLIKFGFISLVSRVHSNGKINPHKLELVNKYTGGIIHDGLFKTKEGVYIGKAELGWFYYQNNLVVTQKKPSGVARKLKRDLRNYFFFPNGTPYYLRDKVLLQDETLGFYGYTHRGGCFFEKGDMLFNEDWTGGFSPKEISKMPYTERGGSIIETLDEAERAAINFSNYLS